VTIIGERELEFLGVCVVVRTNCYLIEYEYMLSRIFGVSNNTMYNA
jgi:hypothetical protein